MKIVLCTAPVESAETLALNLVERRVAACVNVIPAVASVYRWQGRVERSEESLLVVKTTDARLPQLRAAIESLHPYDVPEIVALEVSSVNAAYEAWLESETAP